MDYSGRNLGTGSYFAFARFNPFECLIAMMQPNISKKIWLLVLAIKILAELDGGVGANA